MELLALTCQHCSAPLSVPEGAKFVTCTHCGTQLAVRRTGGVAYTEMLAEIDERTERMEEKLEDLHRRSALAEVDRAWEAEREKYFMTGKHGVKHLPTVGGSIAGGVMITAFGTLWTAIACGMGGMMAGAVDGPFGIIGAIFPLVGVAFVGFGLWTAYEGYRKAKSYEKAEGEWRRRREELREGRDEASMASGER